MLTAFITGLESTDFSGIDPVYARPIVDNSTAEPELPFADVAFPAKIQSLVSQQTRTGPKASAVLVQGQFFSDDTPDAKAPEPAPVHASRSGRPALERDRPGRAALRRHRRGRAARAGHRLVLGRRRRPARRGRRQRCACWSRSATGHRRRGASSTSVAAPGRAGAAPRLRAARRSSTSCRPSTRRATSRSPRTRASCSQPLRRRRRAGRASSRRSPGQRSPAGSSSRRSWTSKRWRASLCRCRLTGPLTPFTGPVTLAATASIRSRCAVRTAIRRPSMSRSTAGVRRSTLTSPARPCR